MKIRRYVGKDATEAIAKVKRDLGSDALILNTKKVRQKKGIMGLFSKQMIEVLAAVDDNNSEKKPAEQPKTAIQSASNSSSDDKVSKLEIKIGSMEEMLQKISQSFESSRMKDENKDETGFFLKLKENLLRNDVAQEVVKQIIDKAKEKVKNVSNLNEASQAVYSALAGIVGNALPIQMDGLKPKIILFIGPTGVGKTTTLAKLAANYSLGQGKKVALLTTDTYRISAVDQLKTYSEIIGIPVSVVYSIEDMPQIIKEYGEKDLIFIDTAGRSHKDEMQFEEIKKIMELIPEMDIFLVLSSVTNNKTIEEIAKKYKFLDKCRLILTKTDESATLGVLVNARSITGMPLSYLTTGQSVPDDIEIVNTDKIIKNLMGSIT